MRLKDLVSNTWTLFVVSADMVQLSQSYNKVESTSALYNFILLENFTFLFFQFFSSFAIVDDAMAILNFISLVDLLSKSVLHLDI